MLHMALAKGRIAKTVMRFLEDSGFRFPEYSDDSRKLIFIDTENSLKITLVKSPDVAVYVRRGAADVGVVGKDILVEDNVEDVYEVLDLGIGKCRMAVAGIKGKQNVLKKRLLVAASKYPRIAREYFAGRHRIVDIVKLNGSVELAPLVGLADVIVDIVETGTTLKENGLEAYEFFMDLSARMICNKVSYKIRQDEIRRLMAAVQKKG